MRINAASSVYRTLSHNFIGASDDQTYSFAYNPAGQITSETSSNSAYDWTPGADFTDYYTVNGLNQYESAKAQAITHDSNENTTS